ncbi:MAG: hypothetical protein R6U19_09490 [Bacteroidales bacterium]
MEDSLLEKYEHKKSVQFKKNERLNKLLFRLKLLLQPIQENIENEFQNTKWPVGFVIGNTRSGTTLLTQWLAALGVFSYPSNFLTRFAYSPYIGALIQEMLFNPIYDFHGDFSDIQSNINFQSDLGKSKGALAVNEFQHFFRNKMNQTDPSYLDGEKLKSVDFEGIRKGFASIEYVFGKPFICKAAILKYNIKTLHDHVNSVFLYIKRKPVFNMQSLLLARKKYYQDEEIWYGSKPKEYDSLIKMDIFHQIAGQVYFTNRHIQNELNIIDSQKQIHIDYEKFCETPKMYFDKIREVYKYSGYEIDQTYNGTSEFKVSNKILLEKNIIDKFEKAYEYFVENYGELRF